MAFDSLHGDIKLLLEKNGAMGVNALQKELNIPLSTLQKYLDKQQNYFIKNLQRKWVLPEQAANSDNQRVSENVTNIIANQISSAEVMLETAMTQLRSTITLMNSHKPMSAPVAGISTNIHPRLVKMQEMTTMMPNAIKQHNKNIPEEYVDILKNVDWLTLAIEKGTIYYNEMMGSELTEIITGNKQEMSDELLLVFEKYQKGA